MNYVYDLHPQDKPLNAEYLREELVQLTTLQLREICQKEKLVVGAAYKLDRPYMIETILKYRGAKLKTFVDTLIPDQFEKITAKFHEFLLRVDAGKRVQLPARITLYKKSDISERDNYAVSGDRLFEGNVLLLDESYRVKGVLNLREAEGGFRLTCNCQLLASSLQESMYRNYSLGFLDEVGSKHLYNYYYSPTRVLAISVQCYIKPVAELLIADTGLAGSSLTIDFGTSNTAAGAYL